jgi:hypothetical protein
MSALNDVEPLYSEPVPLPVIMRVNPRKSLYVAAANDTGVALATTACTRVHSKL